METQRIRQLRHLCWKQKLKCRFSLKKARVLVNQIEDQSMSRRHKNSYILNNRRRLLHYLLWHLGYYEDILPVHIPPDDFSYPRPSISKKVQDCSAQWIGHCTFLIDVYGLKILTDPIWSSRCSPLPFAGPKRQHDLCIELHDLERVDFVLISHNHYDHLDHRTVVKLNKRFPNIIWVVPLGLKRWFKKRGVTHIKELSWWDSSHLHLGSYLPSIHIHSVPAQHNSGRGMFDRDKTLWMGHVVEVNPLKGDTKTLYFVGDTAYNPFDFKKIGDRFPSIDLCLCPIGTYKPERFMRTVHSSPEDAVNIHKDVKSSLSIGMHWKSFTLSYEHPQAPAYDLYKEVKRQGLKTSSFLAIEPGEIVSW